MIIAIFFPFFQKRIIFLSVEYEVLHSGATEGGNIAKIAMPKRTAAAAGSSKEEVLCCDACISLSWCGIWGLQ